MRNWSDVEAEAALPDAEAATPLDPAAPLFQHRRGVERALAVWDEGLDIGGLAMMVRLQQAVIFQMNGTILVLSILEKADGEKWGSVIAIVGERDDAYLLSEAAYLYCRDRGCSSIRSAARKGWLRDKRTRAQGWRLKAALMERRIT